MEQGAATESPSQAPSDWTVDPLLAWFYLAFNVVFVVGRLWPASLALGIVAAVLTYRERRKYGFPTFWWTAGVLVFGPVAYLGFVYRRSRPAIAYPPIASTPASESD